MKRYLLRLKFLNVALAVVLIQLCFLPASGQVPELQNSENFRLIKLHYSNSSGEEGITEFEYDAFGHMVFSHWKLVNGERSSKNCYKINAAGQIIEKSRVFSDSITSRKQFEYNLCGKLVKETFSRSDGAEGLAVYHFNEHGKLAYTDCKNYNGWFTGIIKYKYNVYEVIDEAVINKDNQEIGTIVYQYDIDGNLKVEKWDFNGLWEQTFIYEYIDKPEKVNCSPNPYVINRGFYQVEEEFYEYTDGGSGPSKYEYTDGRLVKKTFVRSDGLTTETSYQYDDNGNLLSSLRKYSDGKTADFTYTFDKNDRMTKRSFTRADGLTGEEIYTYDQEGRLAMAVYKKMDAWLSGTIAFSHDEQGLPIKGYFKGEDGFDADIYFYYDDYKNLVKILWDFSFGKSQVYTFKYRNIYQSGKNQIATVQ
jgi:hypothetical protein